MTTSEQSAGVVRSAASASAMTPHIIFRSIRRALLYIALSIAALKRIRDPLPDVRLLLAAALARQERPAEAGAEMTRFRETRPNWTVEKERRSVCFLDIDDEEHWLAGVRLAGLPEEGSDVALAHRTAHAVEQARSARAVGPQGVAGSGKR